MIICPHCLHKNDKTKSTKSFIESKGKPKGTNCSKCREPLIIELRGDKLKTKQVKKLKNILEN